jgi:putative ABC transport system permease protein
MNALVIVVAQLRRRPLQTVLSVLLLALGVATMVFVLLLHTQLARQITRDVQGVDVVVGAKGSPLQLILSAVYHVDIPTGNVPLAVVEQLRANRFVSKVIPLALGDNVQGFRIVGTEPALVEHYGARLAAGALWSERMQAVVGAQVARQANLSVGSRFSGAHGLAIGGPLHEDAEYRVVGVLAATGTVLDRLALTGIESIWFTHEGDADSQEGKMLKTEREVTALLVQYASPLAAALLPRQINAEPKLMAAVPASELARLFAVVGVGIDTLRAFALILFGAALIAMFIALTSALEERRYDIAVMRMLGASRSRVATMLLMEGWLLALIALLLGTCLGFAAVQIVGTWMAQSRSFSVSAWAWTPELIGVLAIALAVATVAALIPAWRASRMDVHATLAEG